MCVRGPVHSKNQNLFLPPHLSRVVLGPVVEPKFESEPAAAVVVAVALVN